MPAPTVTLPSIGPVGAEILVNTATVDTQGTPQITTLAGGGFVVTWADNSLGVGGAGGDTSASAIKAQVFAVDGSRVGSELLINTATNGAQTFQEIAALSNGGFVVTWADASLGVGGATGDTSSNAIKAQVFTADGSRVGSELLVNTATNGMQNVPQITVLSNGGFVVTWQDSSAGVGGAGGDTSSLATKAQVFAADGSRVGSEILVNTATISAQGMPQITGLSNGGFVVTWQDGSLGVGGAGGDTSALAIKAQVFGADGSRVGTEFLVNTATFNTQNSQQITALEGGGFVITWRDFSSGDGGATGDTSGAAIKAQVFAADGSRVGSELLVNTATVAGQDAPQITALSNGGFVVSWQDSSAGVGGATGDTSALAVKAQVFAADGSRVGDELLVNTATAGSQASAEIKALSHGGFVVVWLDGSTGVGGAGGDTSGTAVKAQVFAADGSRLGSELLVNTATANAQDSAQITALSNGGFVVTWRDLSQGVGGAGGDTSLHAVKAQVFGVPLAATEQVDFSLKGTGINIADADVGDVQTVTLSVDYGILTVTAGTSGATVAGSGTASVTLTGTAAQVTALLNSDGASSVLYTANTNVPPSFATVTVSSNDGSATASANTVIRLTAVNDAPTAAGLPSDVTVAQGVASNLDLSAVTVADADTTGAIVLTLTASTGTMTATSGGGVTLSGSGTGTLTLSGTASAIDAYLNSASAIQYTGASGVSGNNAATLTVTANDGSGVVTLGTVNIDITAADSTAPTATVVVADTALSVGETSLVTVTFSEAVTGFTTADLTVANGTVSALSSSDGGVTWTATLTPTAATMDATNLITLNNTGVTDLAGNAGTGTTDSNNYSVDTVRPTASIVVADTSLTVGETSGVTITFSEAVTGFTTADLTVANGTVSALSSSDGGITWTATLTPTAATTDATNLITLDNTGVTDLAGNAGTGTTDSNNYSVDTARPTATIVVADTALSVGETSLVTVTFSEAVTGFTTADLTVANGTVSALSSADGGVTWTTTLTPTASVSDTTNLIALDNTGVQDAAGNFGAGTTLSNNYVIDTLRPTATVVVSDTSLTIGETSLVTITFSEAVTGFTNADLTIENGTLSAVSSSDGGVTWTATLTPAASVSDTTNVITLNNTGVQDAYGNVGIGTSVSSNYAISTVAPPPPPSPPPPPPPMSQFTGASDVVTLSDAGETISALDGDDRVTGGSANDSLRGDAGADTLFGGNGNDVLEGGSENDVLQGNAGDDSIFGGMGDDITRGGQGEDLVHGDAGADTLFGDLGADTVEGGQGDDVIQGNGGNDLVFGGLGDDIMLGGQGNDIVQGNGGNDVLFGDLGDDIVRGGQGNDWLFGGAGADFLSGDAGDDTISGGAGADVFYVFSGSARDVVLDFNPMEGDRVRIDPGVGFAITQVGTDTIVTLSTGDSIVLLGFQSPPSSDGWIIGV